MTANEQLVVRLHQLGYRLRDGLASRAGADALFAALMEWQVERIREIRHMTDWLDDAAHTLPGMPMPRPPSEDDDEEAAPGDPSAAKGAETSTAGEAMAGAPATQARRTDLRTLRKQLGLKQQALADLLGVTRVSISEWERVEGRAVPRRALLATCALVMHKERDWSLLDQLGIPTAGA